MLTVADYEDAGTVVMALSDHADQVCNGLAIELDDRSARRQIEHLFRALTDIDREGRAIRWPRTLGELIEIIHSEEKVVRQIVDAFRADGCSFLTPYAPRPIGKSDMIDISHEALIRRWRQIADAGIDEDGRPQGWLYREFEDGLIWRTLVVQARTFAQNREAILSAATTGKWLTWLDNVPSPAWTRRHMVGHAGIEGQTETQRCQEQWHLVQELMAASRLAMLEEHSWASRRIKQELYRRETAQVVYSEAIDVISNVGPQHGEADEQLKLAVRAMSDGRYGEAEERLRIVLNLVQQAGDAQLEAGVLSQLGIVASRQGRLEEADQLLRQAFYLLEAVEAPSARAATEHQLALVLEERGSWNEAAQCYKHAAEMRMLLGDRIGQAQSLSALANAMLRAERLQESEEAFQRLFTVAEHLRDRQAMAQSSQGLARVAQHRGDLKTAMTCLRHALQYLGPGVDHRTAASLYEELGTLLANAEEWQEAEEALQMALKNYSLIGDRERCGAVLSRLTDIARARGDHERADDYARRADSLTDVYRQRKAVRSVFISHAHRDRALAELLRRSIADAFGGRLVVELSSGPDSDGIVAGTDWVTFMAERVAGAEAVLVVLTPQTARSPGGLVESGILMGAAAVHRLNTQPIRFLNVSYGITVKDVLGPFASQSTSGTEYPAVAGLMRDLSVLLDESSRRSDSRLQQRIDQALAAYFANLPDALHMSEVLSGGP